MSTQSVLKAEKREGRGKGGARKLRATGRVPAVIYGKDEETLSLSLDAQEAESLFTSISVENTIVDLKIKGVKSAIRTLIRQIQVHPIRPILIHVDFLRIRAGVKLDVEIPVNLNGIPEGVKNSGGILQQIIHELPVRVLPSKIPETIEVDVSMLEMGDSIHISDLEFDEDLEILIDPERTMATVVAPKVVEEEPEEEEEIEGEEIEGEEVEGEAGEAPTDEKSEASGSDEGGKE